MALKNHIKNGVLNAGGQGVYSRKIGIHESYISRLLNDQFQNISNKKLKEISVASSFTPGFRDPVKLLSDVEVKQPEHEVSIPDKIIEKAKQLKYEIEIADKTMDSLNVVRYKAMYFLEFREFVNTLDPGNI